MENVAIVPARSRYIETQIRRSLWVSHSSGHIINSQNLFASLESSPWSTQSSNHSVSSLSTLLVFFLWLEFQLHYLPWCFWTFFFFIIALLRRLFRHFKSALPHNTTDILFYQLMFCVYICTLYIKKLSCFSPPENHSYSCWVCMTCQTTVVWFRTQQKQITELNARWNQFGKKTQEDGRHKSVSRLSVAWVRTDSWPQSLAKWDIGCKRQFWWKTEHGPRQEEAGEYWSTGSENASYREIPISRKAPGKGI